jgi:hypothetical protein
MMSPGCRNGVTEASRMGGWPPNRVMNLTIGAGRRSQVMTNVS